MKQSKPQKQAQDDDYFAKMFEKQKPKESKQDDITPDAIGDGWEQHYFQEDHTGHHVAYPHPYDAYDSYYYGMFGEPHGTAHDPDAFEHPGLHRELFRESLPGHHVGVVGEGPHGFETHYDDFTHGKSWDATHDARYAAYPFYLNTDESQYLALYGAKELFG